MNFIKKIFENQVDEKVHSQFTRYGKGIFEYKALLDINVQAKKVKIIAQKAQRPKILH